MRYTLKTKAKEYLKNLGILKILVWCRYLFRALKYYNIYYKIRSGLDSVYSIQVIAIEFSSICNLKCKYCFLEKRDRPNFLDIAIYEKLLSEICENKKYNIKIIEWPISGCFFLHPDYKEIIKITTAYKEKYPDFSPWIILNDNMVLFNEEKIDFILNQNVINQIICSIDGVDKETFEKMRPKADFETVIKNTFYLLRKNKNSKKKAVLQINNGQDASCVDREIDPRLKEIFSRVDYITQWNPLDWNESFHTKTPLYSCSKGFCSFVFESAAISSSGAVTKCCMDLKEATKYGDFTKNTLESIWLSEKRLSFLRAMHAGKRHLIPGCNTCSIKYVKQNKI